MDKRTTMTKPKSQFVEMETMPITELCKSPVGTEAVYFLSDIEGMSVSYVLAKFSSGVKANFARAGNKCEIKSSRLMYGLSISETLASKPAVLVRVVNDE